jgi:hypothetical protein
MDADINLAGAGLVHTALHMLPHQHDSIMASDDGIKPSQPIVGSPSGCCFCNITNIN